MEKQLELSIEDSSRTLTGPYSQTHHLIQHIFLQFKEYMLYQENDNGPVSFLSR